MSNVLKVEFTEENELHIEANVSHQQFFDAIKHLVRILADSTDQGPRDVYTDLVLNELAEQGLNKLDN